MGERICEGVGYDELMVKYGLWMYQMKMYFTFTIQISLFGANLDVVQMDNIEVAEVDEFFFHQIGG